MSSTTVHVEGISGQTSEKEVRDFFSFCGKIQNLSITPTADGNQSATVVFEKESATKTALLLDNTQLGPTQIHVTAAKSLDDLAGDKAASAEQAKDEHGHDVAQEDKPKSRVIAEYLAHGYLISDKAIEQALALDQKHGFSTRFTSALKTFDDRFQATQKAQAADTKLGVTDKAYAGWRGLNSYFEKALGTPTGQKLRQFYIEGNKQVVDVHNEARHLANLKGSKQTGATGDATASTSEKPSVEEAGVEQISGTDKTRCNCGSSSEKCACPPGKCGCANCGNSEASGGPVPAAI